MVSVLLLFILLVSNGASYPNRDQGWCDVSKNNTYPLEDNVTNECHMIIHESDKLDFVHNVIISDYKLNFWKLSLEFPNVTLSKARCVIQPLKWVWTYPGEYGAVNHLYWPESFRLWSLGILSVDTKYIPKRVRMYVKGNCSVTIGEAETTERIGLALIQMANDSALIKAKPEIEYSYFCYTEQIWINSKWLYHLCLHLVCPLHSMGRKCCKTVYEYETRRKRVVCEAEHLQYGSIWWQYPFLIATVMFAYFPLLLLRIACSFSLMSTGDCDSMNVPEGWLLSNPISTWNLLKIPMMKLYSNNRNICSKIIKICLVCLSLIVIMVEIIVSYKFEYDYVTEGVIQGVPMNFLSVLAGFTASRNNYLYFLGGPFVALSVYIVSLSLLLCVPKTFSKIIENGICDNINVTVSLFSLDLKSKGRFGGTYDLHQLQGTNKFYSLLRSHLFMLISTKTWIFGIRLQVQRLRGWIHFSRNKSIIFCLGMFIVIPFYIIVCIFEWVIIIVYFSIPIIPFFLVIVKGFWNSLRLYCKSKLCTFIIFPVIVFGLAYNIYLFSVVFVESFVFISRIFIFTLTGFIAFPNKTYVYLVLAITISMYVVENTHSVKSVYDDYYRRIHAVCTNVAEGKSRLRFNLLRKHGDAVLLSKGVFKYVIRRHRPVKIDVCFSVFKILLIVFVLFLSISVIVSFKNFQMMESLTQVATVLFICLVPKLWKRLCRTDNKLNIMKENANIRKSVEDYCTQILYSRQESQIDDPSKYINDDECAELVTPILNHSDESGDELLFDPM